MIREPAAAVAAAICWLARWRGMGKEYTPGSIGLRHPVECSWCIYPPDELILWIEEFNDLDLIRGRDYYLPSGHAIAADYMRLLPSKQRELTDAVLYGDGASR